MASAKELEETHWRRLSALLDEALALDPAARAAWLDELPDQHGELLLRLRSTLARDTAGKGDFLSSPVVLPELLQEFVSDEDAVGTEIGPYRLVAELGAGGMGRVWIAERSDGLIKRQVALKLPLSHWAPGLAERMQRERDILASLEHPNIARLYDAGMTKEGRPYLALEYVDGKPIDVYCREQNLDIKSRLKLFLQVAQAVSHAHGRLVVHRDLKPNNILVTNTAEVRLLDFGIAKLLSGDTAPVNVRGSQLTRITGRTLTLDYASPEQIRGERVTIASDTYSLGVVLYELLAGRRPHKPRRKSIGAIEEAITEQDAPLASRVADARIANELRGDLDVILAKALSRKTAYRYQSAESFAADVTRYLRGEPVLARPASRWYKTQKFVRRNIVAVGATVAVFLAIGAGTGVAFWQAREARIEANRAEEVKRFIASIFGSAVPRTGVGGEVLATDLLAAAAERIEKELAGNPRAAAELGVIVGESFGYLGHPDMGERVLRAATERSKREFGRSHPISIRAKLLLTAILKHKEPKTAEAMVDDAIVEAKALLPITGEQLVDALAQKGFIASQQGRVGEAITALHEAVEIGEKHVGLFSKSTIFNMGLLANTYGVQGKRGEQLAFAKEAVNRAEKELGASRPDIVLIAAERFYASALRGNDRPADAIPILRRVLADQRQLDSAETGRVRYAMHELGLALAAVGQMDEALSLQRKVVVFEQAQNNYESVNRVIAGEPLVNSLLVARRIGEAAAEDQRILAVQERIGEETPRHEFTRLNRRALLLALRSSHVDAERTALDVAHRAKVEFPKYRANALRIAAFNARMQRKPEKAMSYLNEIALVKVPEVISLQDSFEDAAERGAALLDLNLVEEAESSFLECRRLYEKAQVRLSVRVATCTVGLARVQLRRNRAEEAYRSLSSLTVDWERVNPQSEWHGESLYWLARAQEKLGLDGESRANFARAKAMLRKSSLPALRHLLTPIG